MAEINEVHMVGIVKAKPLVIRGEDESMAKVSIVTSRADRKVENGEKFMRLDQPYIITKDVPIIDKIDNTLDELDIVMVYGVISTRKMPRSSVCP